MAISSKKIARVSKETTTPKCAAIADAGITTSRQFTLCMSALMGDIVSGRIAPQVASAMCNAGGKMLKVVEMEYRYGKRKSSETGTLHLSS